MPVRSLHAIAAAATGILLACAAPAEAGASLPAVAGTVRVVKAVDSSDARLRDPTQADRLFVRSHYWRLRAYSPYFDSRLAWAPNAWVYQDAYAIYPGAPEVTEHPDWILHDRAGNKLWIQFDCSNGSCTQYAADIGNPAFRAWWIASAKAKLAAGYKGLFVDDVNMAERVSNGDGDYTPPVDPRTGRELDEAEWQHLMAAFMSEVRAALPDVEIVHNVIWTVGDGSPDLRRQLDSADYVELERGFNDPGLVGGSGKFGFDTLLAFIDRRHDAGEGVILDGRATTPAARLYGLATYLLVSSGRDALGVDTGDPGTWWSGYDVRLGAPRGGRYLSGGLWRRDFARGTVLVNEPGSPPRRVEVGSGFRDLGGTRRTTVTLAGGSGDVLLRAGG
jgi:hypothetical protein